MRNSDHEMVLLFIRLQLQNTSTPAFTLEFLIIYTTLETIYWS